MNFTTPIHSHFFAALAQFSQAPSVTLRLLREASDAYEDAVGDVAVALARLALAHGTTPMESPWAMVASHTELSAAVAQRSPALEQFRASLAHRDELAHRVEWLQAQVEREQQAIEDESLDFGWQVEPIAPTVPEEFCGGEGCLCGEVPEFLPDGNMM